MFSCQCRCRCRARVKGEARAKLGHVFCERMEETVSFYFILEYEQLAG